TSSSSTSAGGAKMCSPGDMTDCYEGPKGTEGVGTCKGGKKTCNADGSGWGGCVGQTLPAAEACPSDMDTDCSGQTCGKAVWAIGGAWGTVNDAAADSAGNVLLGGTFLTTFAFPDGGQLVSGGGEDAFVAKLDAQGKHVWSKRFGDGEGQGIESL